MSLLSFHVLFSFLPPPAKIRDIDFPIRICFSAALARGFDFISISHLAAVKSINCGSEDVKDGPRPRPVNPEAVRGVR